MHGKMDKIYKCVYMIEVVKRSYLKKKMEFLQSYKQPIYTVWTCNWKMIQPELSGLNQHCYGNGL